MRVSKWMRSLGQIGSRGKSLVNCSLVIYSCLRDNVICSFLVVSFKRFDWDNYVHHLIPKLPHSVGTHCDLIPFEHMVTSFFWKPRFPHSVSTHDYLIPVQTTISSFRWNSWLPRSIIIQSCPFPLKPMVTLFRLNPWLPHFVGASVDLVLWNSIPHYFEINWHLRSKDHVVTSCRFSQRLPHLVEPTCAEGNFVPVDI